MLNRFATILMIAALPAAYASAQTNSGMMGGGMMQGGMMVPSMDPTNGRKLFASKGCVVCHAVNGIGGKDAAALDASTMPGMTNPLDFVASMWRGAGPMIDMPREELGAQVEFTGQELGDIIGFLHNEAEQKKFSEADIPANIKTAMAKRNEVEETETSSGMMGGTSQGGMLGSMAQGGMMMSGQAGMMVSQGGMMMKQGMKMSEADQGYMTAMQAMGQNMMKMEMTGDPSGDFVRMMIPHHQSAIDMGQVLLKQKNIDPEIRSMAEDIIRAQTNEIEKFQAWLKTHNQ